MFPEFSFLGISIPAYGLISFVGFIVAVFLGLWLIGKRNISKGDFLSVSIAVGFGVVAGANFLYALTRIGDILDAFASFGEYGSLWEFIEYLYTICGGMVFYGGLYGGLIFGALWSKHKKYSLKDMADVFSVLIPLFHTFGRIGCFFAGCCYGVKAHWGISGRVITADVKESSRRIPIQLIEAFFVFCLFIVILWLFSKKIARGKLIYIYLLIYAVLRFVLEFFRGDEIRGHFLVFSTSQWISVFTLLWVSIYLLITKTRKQKFHI